jgi:predicted Zn-dependent protease
MSSIQVWAHGDVGGQVQALTERIQQEPRNAALYLRRGELQRHLQHWELAEQDLDRAEQLDRKLTAIHLSRALLLVESGHRIRLFAPSIGFSPPSHDGPTH